MNSYAEFSALLHDLIGAKADRVLASFSDARALAGAGEPELTALGVTQKQLRTLKAGIELGRCSVREELAHGLPLGSSMAVFQHYRPVLGLEVQEVFLALALDAHNRLRREIVVARGTLTSCPVHPREVFRPLIREAAAATLLVHNHPSGDPEPSEDDLVLTRRLVRAGALVGIQVLDHVIIGQASYVSLAERGAIP